MTFKKYSWSLLYKLIKKNEIKNKYFFIIKEGKKMGNKFPFI